MTPENRAPANNRTWLIILAVIILGTLFRLFSNQGTLSDFYTENFFRVGMIPWSDARGWVDGALAVLSGDAIKGYPAFRPLTPLFLSDMFFLTGVDYWRGMAGQWLLLLAATATAAVILRNVKPRFAVLIFIALLCLWRPGIESTFTTEIPGMIVLIPAIALLWRGALTARWQDICAGLLLFGLNQAIRPWNILSLFLLPFIAFHGPDPLKRKTGIFFAYLACGMMGFMFHPLAATIFNGPGEASGNEDKALIGRVTGDTWMAYYFDPVISKARNDNRITPQELRGITYRRAFELFKEHPDKFLITIKDSYLKFFTGLRLQFGESRWTGEWFIAGLLLLLWLGTKWRVIELNQTLLRLPPRKKGIAIASLLLLIFAASWFLLAAAIWGLIRLLRRPLTFPAWMIILYGAGILLSIPLVGDDGGMRNKIGGDIILFLLAAAGLSSLWFSQDWETSAEPKSHRWSWRELKPTTWITAAALLILLAIPWLIRVTAVQPPDHNWNVTAAEIAPPRGIKLLDAARIDRIWNDYPQPSFEKYVGVNAFWMEDFRLRDIVYAPAGAGLEKTYNIMQFWPLAPIDENRCILVREQRMAIIPGVRPEKLAKLDGRRVVLYGELITKPRQYLFATGYTLYVLRIGIRGNNGKIEWIWGKK